MSLSLIAYPNLIYVSSAEPADKTAGRIWTDTDTGWLYVSDGTNYNRVGASSNPINQIYTGSGFDTLAQLSATDEDSQELTEISAAELAGKKYVKIKIFCTGRSQNNNPQLKIQEKYVGGAYADLFDYKYISGSCTASSYLDNWFNNLEYTYTLNENDIANGINFMIWSKSVSVSNSDVSLSNIQTIIEVY